MPAHVEARTVQVEVAQAHVDQLRDPVGVTIGEQH